MDCPVSGGEPKAKDGTLAMMAGGSDEDFHRALPYLKLMGATVSLIGPCGSGCIAKLANQIIVNLNITAGFRSAGVCGKGRSRPRKSF